MSDGETLDHSPWPLSRKVLVLAPSVTPKTIAPNLYPLLSRIDPRDYTILTTTDDLADGLAAGRPWLAGAYVFCDDAAATRDTLSAERPTAARARSRRRLFEAVTRRGPGRLLRNAAARALRGFAVLKRTARFIRAGLRTARDSGCEFVLGMSDTGPAIIATFVIARVTRTPYAYYVRDLYRGNRLGWPERWLARWLEDRMFTGAEYVITTNDATADYYRRRYGSRIRLDVVHIVADDEVFADDPPPYAPAPPYTITYTGSVYWAQWQAVANCIEAMGRLVDVPVQLRLYCPQPPPDLIEMAAKYSNVWLGVATPSEMPRIQREATLLLVALTWREDARDIVATATPGKSVEYLAAGRPLLVHAPDFSYISRHARKHRLGLVVDRNDPAAVAEAVREFLREPEVGREFTDNALAMSRRRHNPEVAAEQFRSILNGKHSIRQ